MNQKRPTPPLLLSSLVWKDYIMLGAMEVYIRPAYDKGEYVADKLYLDCYECGKETPAIMFWKDGRIDGGDVGHEFLIDPSDPIQVLNLRLHEPGCPFRRKKKVSQE